MTKQVAQPKEIGAKVRNRHSSETGMVETIASNGDGTWYHVTTLRGMSIGWWHETDVAEPPKSVPPARKSNDATHPPSGS